MVSGKKRGITLVELLVVAAIISGITGAIYMIYVNFQSQNRKMTREQEFVQLQSRMLSILKGDLRSSEKLVKNGENSYTVKKIIDEDDAFIIEDIEWEYDPQKKIVTRNHRGEKKFDFSKLLPEKDKFIFSIEN